MKNLTLNWKQLTETLIKGIRFNEIQELACQWILEFFDDPIYSGRQKQRGITALLLLRPETTLSIPFYCYQQVRNKPDSLIMRSIDAFNKCFSKFTNCYKALMDRYKKVNNVNAAPFNSPTVNDSYWNTNNSSILVTFVSNNPFSQIETRFSYVNTGCLCGFTFVSYNYLSSQKSNQLLKIFSFIPKYKFNHCKYLGLLSNLLILAKKYLLWLSSSFLYWCRNSRIFFFNSFLQHLQPIKSFANIQFSSS